MWKSGRSFPGNRTCSREINQLQVKVKSNNTPGIARKLQNGLYEFPSLSHGGPIPGLVTQQLPIPYNSGLMQSLVACRVANLAFLKPNFEIRDFLTHLAFFENQKYQSKSGFFFFIFFSLKDLTLAKHCLSCMYITNIFWRESMTMQGAKNIAKILLLP